jgi:hypothetical protein
MNTLWTIVVMNCLAFISHLIPLNRFEKLMQMTAIGYLSLPQPSRQSIHIAGRAAEATIKESQ